MTEAVALVTVLLESGDVVDDPDGARSVNSRRNAFLMDAQVVFFKLVQIFKFTF